MINGPRMVLHASINGDVSCSLKRATVMALAPYPLRAARALPLSSPFFSPIRLVSCFSFRFGRRNVGFYRLRGCRGFSRRWRFGGFRVLGSLGEGVDAPGGLVSESEGEEEEEDEESVDVLMASVAPERWDVLGLGQAMVFVSFVFSFRFCDFSLILSGFVLLCLVIM